MALDPAAGQADTLGTGSGGPGLTGKARTAADAGIFDNSDVFSRNVPDWVGANYSDKQKAKFVRTQRQLGGRGIAGLQVQRDTFGYGDPEEALRQHVQSGLDAADANGGSPVVNTHHDESTTLPLLAKYAEEHLGSGLTPQEWANYNATNVETIEGSSADARRQLANRLQASGMGQSGAAIAGAGQLDDQRLQALSAAKRDLIAKDLARKSDLEKLATGVSQQEEQARQFDTGAEQDRLAKLEAEQAGLADMGEARREYDTGYVEARRQSRLSRQLLAQALARANPTGWERTASITGGILGGLGG